MFTTHHGNVDDPMVRMVPRADQEETLTQTPPALDPLPWNISKCPLMPGSSQDWFCCLSRWLWVWTGPTWVLVSNIALLALSDPWTHAWGQEDALRNPRTCTSRVITETHVWSQFQEGNLGYRPPPPADLCGISFMESCHQKGPDMLILSNSIIYIGRALQNIFTQDSIYSGYSPTWG